MPLHRDNFSTHYFDWRQILNAEEMMSCLSLFGYYQLAFLSNKPFFMQRVFHSFVHILLSD